MRTDSDLIVKSAGSGLIVVALVITSYKLMPPPDPEPACNTQGISVAVSPEKFTELAEIAFRFNQSRCPGGGYVDVFEDSSGNALDGLIGTWKPELHNRNAAPDAWTPSSTAWVRILRHTSPGRTVANWTDSGLPSVTRTPMVLAEPVLARDAGATHQGDRSTAQTSDFIGPAVAVERRVATTNPRISTMGLNTLLETYAAAAGVPMPDRLTEDLVRRTDVKDTVAATEDGKIGAGETTISYLCALARSGKIGTARVVPIEEKSLIDYNRGRVHQAQGIPCSPSRPVVGLRPIYPADGTLISDSPYAILAGDPAKVDKAEEFLRFIQGEGQQVLEAAGFRALDDGRLDSTASIDLGMAPGRPAPAMEQRPLPSGAVLAAIRDSWNDVRRPILVSFLIDVSGSMTCPVTSSRDECTAGGTATTRMTAAKEAILGASGFADESGVFNAQDRVNVTTFGGGGCRNGRPRSPAVDWMTTTLEELPQPRGNTPLYTCLVEAQRHLQDFDAGSRPYRRCIVVLSDGRNDTPDHPAREGGRYVVDKLPTDVADELRTAYARNRVHVFTVALGAGAPDQTLEAIATITDGDTYLANGSVGSPTGPDSIDKALRTLVSNF